MDDSQSGAVNVEIQSLYTKIADIASNPSNALSKLNAIKEFLGKDPKDERFKELKNEAKRPESKRHGETVLHTSIKLFNGETKFVLKKLIKWLVTVFPKLIEQDRGETDYAGQTPLHMAVCKENVWMVSLMLKEISGIDNLTRKASLLKSRATGSVFQNTVMMGELLLSIAALSCNKEIFDLLLDNGAELDGTNSQGDTVCHSLIKYAYLYKDKLGEVLKMCRYISEDPKAKKRKNLETDTFSSSDAAKQQMLDQNRKLRKKMWLMENKEGLSPLQLSAKLGQHELFGFIQSLGVYCSVNSNDGLFDIKVYDVTEIDTIAAMGPDKSDRANPSGSRKNTMAENVSTRKANNTKTHSCSKSVLMMLLELEPVCAFQFLQFPQLRKIIDEKWYAYRRMFYLWSIIHFTFICFLTWYAVERAQQNHNNGTGYDVTRKPNFKRKTSEDAFVTTFGAIALLFSVIYFAQELVRVVKCKMPWTFNSFVNPYCNGWFRVMFVLMGVCLVADFFASIWSEDYENYFLIVAVIIGWFSIIFFLRVIRPFSFFTVLILKVLIRDMLRFFVVLSLELVAFSTAMYMVVQGSEIIEDTDFSDFGRVLLSMLKLMVGLGEVAALYSTRHPALAILIFVGFLIMTTLLMMNALIAMMSKTCSELVENVGNINAGDLHWKLQRLSTILFIESILPLRMFFKVGKEEKGILCYNNRTGRRKKMRRFMLEVRSLDEDVSAEDSAEVSSSWGIRTRVFNAFKNSVAPAGKQDHINRRDEKKPKAPPASNSNAGSGKRGRYIWVPGKQDHRRDEKKPKAPPASNSNAGSGKRGRYIWVPDVLEASGQVFSTTRTLTDVQSLTPRLDIYEGCPESFETAIITKKLRMQHV